MLSAKVRANLSFNTDAQMGPAAARQVHLSAGHLNF